MANILTKALQSAFQTKSYSNEPASSRSLWHVLRGENASWMDTKNYNTLVVNGYLDNSVASRCIDLISTAIADINYQVVDKRTGKPIEDTELEELLRRPSVCQSKSEFFYTLQMYKMISGNSFIHRIMVGNTPMELELFNPAHVEIIEGQTKIPAGFRYTPNHLNENFNLFDVDQITGDSDVLHLKCPHPIESYLGLSPLARVAREIQQFNSGSDANEALLKNNAQPSGVLSFKDALDADGEESIRNQFMKNFTGVKNNRKPLVVSDATWTPTAFTAVESDFLETKKDLARAISVGLGVPPQMVGDVSSSTFNNVAELKLSFYTDTVMPYANSICDELNYWLVPLFDDRYELKVNVDEIMALQPLRDKAWERYGGLDVLTIDERRAMLGFEPLPSNESVTDSPTMTSDGDSEEVDTDVTESSDEVKEMFVFVTGLAGIDGQEHTHTYDPETGMTDAGPDGHTHVVIDGSDQTSIAMGHRHTV